MGAFVAFSDATNGSMYIPTDQTNTDVIEHRTAWLQSQGISIEDATRVHITYDREDFCTYREVTSADKGIGMRDGNLKPADALVTREKNLALFLPVADCVAATFYDPEQEVVMLSHLGRHSLEQQGGTKSVQYLVEHYGSNPAALKVWLGPAPSKSSYPIFKLDNKGMKEAAFEQLATAGINKNNITDNPADTDTDDRYYSYSVSLKGDTAKEGRQAMVAMLTDNAFHYL